MDRVPGKPAWAGGLGRFCEAGRSMMTTCLSRIHCGGTGQSTGESGSSHAARAGVGQCPAVRFRLPKAAIPPSGNPRRHTNLRRHSWSRRPWSPAGTSAELCPFEAALAARTIARSFSRNTFKPQSDVIGVPDGRRYAKRCSGEGCGAAGRECRGPVNTTPLRHQIAARIFRLPGPSTPDPAGGTLLHPPAAG